MRRQRGVALITALLVVAVAAGAAATLATSMTLGLRRSGNLLLREQAWQVALGGEAFAMTLLRRDAQNSRIDTLDEFWAQTLPPLPIEGGMVTGRLSDLQAHLNLNNLWRSDGKANLVAVDRLRNLLRALKLDPTPANAVLDWIDADNTPAGPGGAEDDYYLNLDPPYRCANRPLTSPSELRLVRGITTEVADKLLPEVSVLPAGSAININTASDATLHALGLNDNGVARVKAARPFKSMAQFKELRLLDGDNAAGLDVRTEYFLLEAQVELGRTRLRLYSIIHRDANGRPRVIARSLGTL